MKYEIWQFSNGEWYLISSHRTHRAARSHFDSYVRQGKGNFELRRAR
jgi:hypothetical protein